MSTYENNEIRELSLPELNDVNGAGIREFFRDATNAAQDAIAAGLRATADGLDALADLID